MSQHETTLIVGADSTIGHQLLIDFHESHQPVLGTTRRVSPSNAELIHLNLLQDLHAWVSPIPIAAAVICAGVTKFETCRRSPDETAKINVDGVATLCRSLIDQGARVIYLSSNAVFDGSRPFVEVGEEPSPISEYGRQKAAAEQRILALGAAATVVRITKVIAPGAALLCGWRETLEKGQAIFPYADRVMAPLPLSFVTTALLRLCRAPLPGIVHLSGRRDITYAAAAQYIAKQIGAPPSLVLPVIADSGSSGEYAGPVSTTLSNARLVRHLQIEVPDVWAALDEGIARIGD